MSEADAGPKAEQSQSTPAEHGDLNGFPLAPLDEDEQIVDRAWRDEIACRVARVRSGQAVGRPAADVMAELRQLYP